MVRDSPVRATSTGTLSWRLSAQRPLVSCYGGHDGRWLAGRFAVGRVSRAVAGEDAAFALDPRGCANALDDQLPRPGDDASIAVTLEDNVRHLAPCRIEETHEVG